MRIYDSYSGCYTQLFDELVNSKEDTSKIVLIAFVLLQVIKNPDFSLDGMTRQETVRVYKRYYSRIQNDINGIFWDSESYRIVTLSELKKTWENDVLKEEYSYSFNDYFRCCFTMENGTLENINWRV